MKKTILTTIILTSLLNIPQCIGQVRQWVSSYNGSSNADDAASALAIDGSGNVYVTGYTEGTTNAYAYGTVKYNSMGTQQWVAIYDPTSNNDYANAIAVDGSGNVYVTGVASPSSSNYGTVKYNNSGNEQWSVQYDGGGNLTDIANAIAVDGSGNVYVTGQATDASGNANIATIKYSSSGLQQWIAFYNGSGDTMDVGVSIAVDASGNVYVAGNTISATSGVNYVTIKYNSSGSELWTQEFNGSGNADEEARSMVIDGSGNAYVTGTAWGSGSISNYGTVKYNSSGVLQWSMEYNGTGTNYDAAYDIALDGAGNVYVTGVSAVSGSGFYDYVTIKYSSTGSQIWAEEFNGSGNAADQGNGIAVDASGNVYVTGTSDKPVSAPKKKDYLTVMYDTNGNVQWADEYDGSSSDDDFALDIAVDAGGKVYVTGITTDIGQSFNYTTIKYCTAPDTAGIVTGDVMVCEGETGLTYSVPAVMYATGYTWILPPGATISSGSGTNTIIVTFGSGTTSGSVSVQGTNACSFGIASPSLSITVNPTPPVPTISQSGSVLTSSATTGNQWYLNGVIIPGATSQNYNVSASGNYTVVVSNITGCTSTSDVFVYSGIGISELSSKAGILIYPNPSSGKFIANIAMLQIKGKYEYRVLNTLGEVLIHAISGTSKLLEIDLSNQPHGIYFIEIKSGNIIYKEKMIRE